MSTFIFKFRNHVILIAEHAADRNDDACFPDSVSALQQIRSPSIDISFQVYQADRRNMEFFMLPVFMLYFKAFFFE